MQLTYTGDDTFKLQTYVELCIYIYSWTYKKAMDLHVCMCNCTYMHNYASICNCTYRKIAWVFPFSRIFMAFFWELRLSLQWKPKILKWAMMALEHCFLHGDVAFGELFCGLDATTMRSWPLWQGNILCSSYLFIYLFLVVCIPNVF
jgi:hypothetical protein